MRSAYQPDRGHFVHLNFTPQAGTEQAGKRPALVLSPRAFNVATGLAYVCPITNQMKGGAFECPIPAGSRVTGAVLCDQLRSVDWISRGAEQWGVAPAELLDEVLARVDAVLHPG